MSAAPSTTGRGLLGPALVIAVFLALAAAVRWWGIEAHALWRDELCSLIRSDGHASFGLPPTGVVVPKLPVVPGPPHGILTVLREPNEFIPPLYFVVLRGWLELFGIGTAALRSLSAAASVVTVLLGAMLAGTLGGRRAALVAGLLLALAPLEYRYAQEARPYALMSVFTMLATLAIAHLETGRGSRALLWTLYVVAVAAAVSTHYTGALVPLVHLAWFLALRRPAELRPPRAAVVAGIIALTPVACLLLWQLVTHHEEDYETLNWLAGPDVRGTEQSWLAARAHVPYDAIASVGGFISGLQSSVLRAALFAPFVVLLMLFGLRGGGRRAWLILLLAAAGPATLILVDAALGTGGSKVVRYAFVSSPFLWVSASLGLARLRGPLFALALLLVVAGEFHGTWLSRHRETVATDIQRTAAAMMEVGCDERDLVIAALDAEMQIMELNQFLEGSPFELVVPAHGRFDESGLLHPWRHVFLVAVKARDPQIEMFRSLLAPRFIEQERVEMPNLTYFRFAASSAP